ncbi:MAG TPA: sucrase ferredoxin [Verrucomicrobiae bacterium]|nr:sucrase ferredoxin [Verrucomicrobiae bacterium]
MTSWGRTVLETPGLPSDFKLLLGDLAKRGRKPSMRFYVDDVAPEAGCVHVRLYPDNVGWRNVPVEVLADVLRLYFFAGAQTRPRRLPRDAFFLCVHGAHDQCCGARGPAVLHAARELVKEHGWSIDVFASSHLGGHRFAATGLFFPAGISYGRLGPDTIGRVLEACVNGRVFAPCLRGSVGVSQDVLLAEYVLARRGLDAIRAFDAYEIASVADKGGRTLRLKTTRGPSYEVRVTERPFASVHCPDGRPGKTVIRQVIESVREITL